jgi:hypothetical protein
VGRAGRLKYRHVRRTVTAVVLAALLLTVLVMVVWRFLESRPVQDLTRRQLVQIVRMKTGLDLEVGSLRWGLVPLRIELRDVVVESPGVALRAARADVDVGAFFLARATLVLNSVELSGLDLRLEGLPEGAGGGGRGPEIDVVIKRLDLSDFRFQGESLPGGIDAAAGGVAVSWVLDGASIQGQTSVARLDLDIPGVEPVSVEGSADFRWRDVLEITSFTMDADGLGVQGRGTVAPDGSEISLVADGALDLAELDRVVHIGGVLRGRVDLGFDVDLQRTEPLRVLARSDAVSVAGLPLEALRGSISVGSGGIRGVIDRAVFLGGDLEATYVLDRLAPPFPHSVQGRCLGFDVAAFLEALGAPSGGLAARADATVGLEWNGRRFPMGSGVATATLRPGSGPLPAAGDLEVELTAPGWLQFSSGDLRIGDSLVRLQGPLELGTWEPAWSLWAEPAVMTDVVGLVNGFAGVPVLPPQLGGTGRLDVSLGGRFSDLAIGFRLDVNELELPPMELDRAVVTGTVADGRLDLQPSQFRLGTGAGDVEGSVVWGGVEATTFDLRIDSRSLPLARVAAWLDPPEALAVDGTATFAGGLRGAYGDLRGSWALGLSDAAMGSVSLGDGAATVDLEGGVFTARRLDFDEGLHGRVAWDVIGEAVGIDLRWENMEWPWMPAAARSLIGDRGSWEASVEWPLGQRLSGEVTVDTGRANGRFAIAGHGGQVDAQVDSVGSVHLDLSDESGGWIGTGALQVDSVERLLATLLPNAPVPLSGSLAADLGLTLGPSGPVLSGVVDQVALRLENQPVRLVAPAELVVGSGGFEIGTTTLEVGGDRLSLWGQAASDGRLAGEAQGAVSAVLLRFIAPGWEPAGTIGGRMVLSGSVAAPRVNGMLHVDDGSFRLPGTQSVISAVEGDVLLLGNEIALEDTTFRFMRGAGRCRGGVRLGSGPQLDLSGTITRLEYPLFPDFSPLLSGTWALAGPVDAMVLSGNLDVVRGEVRRKDDIASLLVDWFAGAEVPGGDGVGLVLDLNVTADGTLVSRSAFLRLQGSADLQITGTSNAPGLVGSIEFQEGGEMTLQGIRYELERGQISFADASTIDPFVDLHTRATIREYEVWARLTGTLDRLVPSVSSDPPLSESEIYALMSMGQVGEGRAGGALGLTLASSMLTRGLNEALESRDQWLLPVDQVRVDPRIESSTGNPGARVTVVKQLSPTLTVTLESDISGDIEEVLTARWYLGAGLYVEAIREGDGSYGVDVKLRQRY